MLFGGAFVKHSRFNGGGKKGREKSEKGWKGRSLNLNRLFSKQQVPRIKMLHVTKTPLLSIYKYSSGNFQIYCAFHSVRFHARFKYTHLPREQIVW